MPEHHLRQEHIAAIGPNALTQLFDPIKHQFGDEILAQLLKRAGISTMPDMLSLIDEAPVIRFHTQLHQAFPEHAETIERQAGIGTAHYILANRIPKLAQIILRVLPTKLAAKVLTKAIKKNAWTFTGSGSFKVVEQNPITLEITNNPLVRNMRSEMPLCVWHRAVFETLFRALVSKNTLVTETSCCACGSTCRFEITL